MIIPGKHLINNSGQTLLIAVALALVLVLGLTVVYFVNQTSTSHQIASILRNQTGSVSDEGIAYAMQILSTSSTTWQNALIGTFPNDCNSGNVIVTPSGGRFKLYCSTGTAGSSSLQPYQVAITAVASIQSSTGTEMSLRASQAFLSQRTLGADLATGVHAAAALQMISQPIVSGNLDIEWGPVVCLDSYNIASWAVPNSIDSGQYPRKFSVGGITSSVSTHTRSGNSPTAGPHSDQKEYWAYGSQGLTPLIDETYYIQQAEYETGITPPTSKRTANPLLPTGCLPGGNTTCGYFVPASSDTAIFDGGLPGYPLSGGINQAVVYVDGPAQFNKIAIDSATFIITGSLTVTDASGGSVLNLHVPWSANLEYPYTPTNPATWPCQGQQGDNVAVGQPNYDCASSSLFPAPGNVQFRGFLYVKGYLFVQTSNWNMVGALLVGDTQAPPGTSGALDIAAGNSMNLAYDDMINHGIHVGAVSGSTIKVEPDAAQIVPAF